MPQLLQLLVVVMTGLLAFAPSVLLAGHRQMQLGATALAIPAATCLMPILAGLAAWPNRRFITPGRCERTTTDPTYRRRRYHAACWTLLYYSPAYQVLLSVPWLKRVTFRLFGYHGSCNFTVYPDVWLRDLPVLDISAGAYLSNRCTIGSNLVLKDGKLLVDRIVIGKNAMIGHLTMIAPGVQLGDDAEALHGCALGVRVNVGQCGIVDSRAVVDHLATVGAGARVGASAYIGKGAVLGDGVSIPPGAVVPQRTRLRSQQDVMQLIGAEGDALRRLRIELSDRSSNGAAPVF